MDRLEVGRKVIETSQVIAEGHRANISEARGFPENHHHEQCAITASNTGVFILRALGFSSEEIQSLADSYRSGTLDSRSHTNGVRPSDD